MILGGRRQLLSSLHSSYKLSSSPSLRSSPIAAVISLHHDTSCKPQKKFHIALLPPPSISTMRFYSSLTSLLLANSNANSGGRRRVAAFITPPSISNNIKELSSSLSVRTSYYASSSSFTARYSAVAEDVDQHQSSSNNNNNSGGSGGSSNKGSILGETLTGEILSILHSNTKKGGFAVVKVCEEDLIPGAYNNKKNTVVATTPKATAATPGDDTSKDEEKEETKVELANALFGKPMPKALQKSSTASSSSSNGGVIADGDLTGRTVIINNTNQRGMVVAHRHPIAFVLLEEGESTPTDTTLAPTGEKDDRDDNSSGKCSISPKLVSINPSSIPPGSIVDYLGNSLAVLDDGSVGRSLPKTSTTTANAVLSKNGVDLDNGIGGIGMDGISLMVSNDGGGSSSSSRPIFVPIPKISDIGLIDSPLVSGITAIDALTPIGKGQNMLVIGNADNDDDNDKSSTTTNKRGWMINFLRNVIENSRGSSSSSGEKGKDTTMMRCYYGLTAGDNTVRSNLLNRLKEAGIQDDVVTVLSTRNYNVKEEEEGGGSGGNESLSTEKAMSAAEAVAVAATACSLGEHHALTTGGDSLVFIDDINLHKSLWDITTQFLVQVYGVDAVVEADLQGGSSSEMRGYFSGLIQRAARFNVKKGGGSVTLILLSTLPGDEDQDGNTSSGEEEEPTFEASDFDKMSEKIKTRISMLVKAKVPLTPTNLKKIQIPLPQTSDAENARRLALQHVEDLISMSDGQIWLDDALAKSGRSPPLDPSRSITRVGVGADTVSCRADAPALRSVVGSLRFEFQQAMDVMESKSTATTATTGGAAIVGNKKQVQRRDAFLLAMHQESNEMRKLSHECIALLAASRGHLDAVLAKGGLAGTVEGRQAIDGLIDFVEKNASGVVTEIDSTLDMSIEARSVLEDAITSYFAGDK